MSEGPLPGQRLLIVSSCGGIGERALGQLFLKNINPDSLAVWWLGLWGSTLGGMGLIPDWGSKMPHSTHGRAKKKEDFSGGSVVRNPPANVGHGFGP